LGIDPGTDTSFGANRLLLTEHRIHLENLAGLGEMPPTGGWIIVGGIRIWGGSAHRPPCSG
jgi:kynurenine formamidase